MKHTTRALRSISPRQPLPPAKESETGGGVKRKLDTDHPSQQEQQHRPPKRSHVKGREAPIKNNDFCAACGLYGRFICCDACPNSFHFTCVDPPMDVTDVELMEGDWYCRECEHSRHRLDDPKETKNNVTESSPDRPLAPTTTAVSALFKKLTDDLKTQNPTAYRLPSDITHYFKGVSMGKTGEYVDSSVIKPARHKAGTTEERRLKDKDGNFIYCFRCRKTALHKRIVSCDYCPLHWHMDCLDPPMVYPPTPTRKWMCPNHPDHIMPRIRQRQNPDIVNSVPTKPNNGIVTIVDDESSCFEDDDDDDMKGRTTSSSTSSDTEDEANSVVKYSDVVYRLPISSVKLDFLSHAASLRAAQKADLRDIHPSKQELREWLEGLRSFQEQVASYVKKDLDSVPDESGLHMLARAASSGISRSSTCSTASLVNRNTDVE